MKYEVEWGTVGPFRGQWYALSNFSPHPAWYEGVEYTTSEHAFAAAKSLDPREREWVAEAPGPGFAKRRGRQIQLRPDWEEVKVSVMRAVVQTKFARPEPREVLLATGDAALVEYNQWHDNYWGVCICERCPGKGQNQLGRVLYDLRSEIVSHAR